MTTSRRDLLRTAAAGAAFLPAAACAPKNDAENGGVQNNIQDGGHEGGDAAGKLSTRDIAAAEKTLNLTYTPEERTQMLSGLEGQLRAIAQLRAVDMSNALAPALTFDPRLPGRAYPAQADAIRGFANAASDLPASSAEIAFASIGELGVWLRSGALTSRRLTEIYLDRIEKYGARLECFVTVTKNLALAQADAADAARARGEDKGPLHGVPYVLKDIIDTKGIKTSWGATPYKERVPEADATVTRKLADAGAVLLAKGTSGAIAYGDIWFGGETRNPWNPKEGSSGSSAGPASATAAGLCAFGIGTETLGSIVSPSERCGTTGLRPTFGRVSRAGAMALCWSLDKIGPLCRRAEDTARVLSVLNGYDAADAGSLDAGFAYDGGVDVSRMTVGYVPEWFDDGDDVDRAALDAMRSLGVTLKEFPWPDLPYDLLGTVVEAEAAAAFSELTLESRDDQLRWQEDQAWPNTWRRVRLYSAVDYIQIDRLRRRVMREVGAAFDGFDALLTPNYSGGILTATNFTGHPTLVLRAGFKQTKTRDLFDQPKDDSGETYKTPRAISLVGDLFGEGRIIALGKALEAKLGVTDERPELFAR